MYILYIYSIFMYCWALFSTQLKKGICFWQRHKKETETAARKWNPHRDSKDNNTRPSRTEQYQCKDQCWYMAVLFGILDIWLMIFWSFLTCSWGLNLLIFCIFLHVQTQTNTECTERRTLHMRFVDSKKKNIEKTPDLCSKTTEYCTSCLSWISVWCQCWMREQSNKLKTGYSFYFSKRFCDLISMLHKT